MENLGDGIEVFSIEQRCQINDLTKNDGLTGDGDQCIDKDIWCGCYRYPYPDDNESGAFQRTSCPCGMKHRDTNKPNNPAKRSQIREQSLQIHTCPRRYKRHPLGIQKYLYVQARSMICKVAADAGDVCFVSESELLKLWQVTCQPDTDITDNLSGVISCWIWEEMFEQGRRLLRNVGMNSNTGL